MKCRLMIGVSGYKRLGAIWDEMPRARLLGLDLSIGTYFMCYMHETITTGYYHQMGSTMET